MRFILYFFLLVAAPVLADQDADFLAANDAFRAGAAVKLQRLAQRLKNTPLEGYVNYYQLRMDLDKADAGVMKKFLSRPEDTPMIDRLRGEWLRLLGSRQQWELFDAEYPLLINEDTELTCYALQSRLRNQDQTALREARTLWFSGKGQPESCGAPFEAAISAGVIAGQDISQRLRLALESGNVSLAKQLFSRLDGDQAVSSRALESAAADALRYLDKLKLDYPEPLAKAGPMTRDGPEIALANTGAADEARALSVTEQNSPYRKSAADHPLTRSLPASDWTIRLFLSYLESLGGELRPIGPGTEAVKAQHSNVPPDFYITTEYPLEYMLPGHDQGWSDDFASGCLNLAPVLPETATPMPNERS